MDVILSSAPPQAAGLRHPRRNDARWLVIRPLRNARRNLRNARRQIAVVRKVIRATRRYGTHQPMRAATELRHAVWTLDEAGDGIIRALDRLKDSAHFMPYALGEAPDAPEAFVTTAGRCMNTYLDLVVLSNALEERMKEVAESVKRGDFRKRIVAPRSFAAPLFDHAPHPAARIESLLRRRRRSRPAAVENAPREISRGRAPPLLSVCSL